MVRTLAHALDALCTRNNWDFRLSSLYDDEADLMTQYVPPEKFEGYNEHVVKFIAKTVFRKYKPDVLILTHVNLAVVGVLTRWYNPECQIWLIVHGIEVWRPLSFYKKLILKLADKIVCVSNHTKQQMYQWHKVPLNKCFVLNNAIDPFIPLPATFNKPAYLLDRYSIRPDQQVIFTLTRLASTEQYKGHERVLAAIKNLKDLYPDILYVLSGQYDKTEGHRVKQLIADMDLSANVILTGFIEDGELADHFLMADLFVLPSKKEGFGIVFIEALACGLPVICGNVDGSLDAIRNGELGVAINPDDDQQLEQAMIESLNKPLDHLSRQALQAKCLSHFNEEQYIDNLEALLSAQTYKEQLTVY